MEPVFFITVNSNDNKETKKHSCEAVFQDVAAFCHIRERERFAPRGENVTTDV